MRILFVSLMTVIWLVLSAILFYLLVYHQINQFNVLHLLYAVQHHATPALLFVSMSLSALLIAIIILFILPPTIPNLYGHARFATRGDIQKAGLFAIDGIRLGKAFGKTITVPGYEHVIVFAPTGTGKTTSIAIPNLLHWQESAIVSDIKLTLFDATSAHRARLGQQVYRWNPGARDGQTDGFNPLDLVSENPLTRIDDIQKMALIFIPDATHADPIWNIQARFLFIALVLYVLDTPTISNTIYDVVSIVKNTPDFYDWVMETLTTRDDLDILCQQNLAKFAELHEKTRLSILATFQSHFELFDNPLVVKATSKSDFDIRDLRGKKMTIYVGVTNDNLVRLSPLLSIFYQQVVDVMTRHIPNQNEPHGVLLLMDEFASLKKMDSLQKNMGLFREYKLRVLIMVQELSQLYDIYGRDGAKIFINAKVRVAFTQNDEETCQWLSNQMGNQTLTVKQTSKQLNVGFKNDTKGESIHYISRPLILPAEIKNLGTNTVLIMVQGGIFIKSLKLSNIKKHKKFSIFSKF